MSGKILRLRRVEGTVEELSDRALLSAVAEGDQAALGALYDRFAGSIHGLAARMMGAGSPAIDDIAQSTFLEAYRSARRFRGTSSVRSWLFGIAANLIRDHFRKEGRRSAVMSEVARQPTRAKTSPVQAAELSENQRRLAAAIEQLPPALKEAYVLCVVEELPGKDAARALGIRTGSLWRRLHDARAALRRLLGGAP